MSEPTPGRTMKEEWRRDPVTIEFGDGRRYATETLWTTVDDWRQTCIGWVNFGHVALGPTRPVTA